MNTQSGRTAGIQYGSSSSVSHSHTTASPYGARVQVPDLALDAERLAPRST